MTRASYVQTLPARPYCVASLGQRLLIRDATKAAQFPFLQHNSHMVWRWMVFDIDGSDAYDRA